VVICGVVHCAVLVVARQSMRCADCRCFGGAAGPRTRLLICELLHVFWWVMVKCPKGHCGGVVGATLAGQGTVLSLSFKGGQHCRDGSNGYVLLGFE